MSDEVRLIADIGGTNARFALFNEEMGVHRQLVLHCADHDEIVTAIRTYLSMVDNPPIREAALAIATAIVGDEVNMTNHHWSFSIEALKQQLSLDTLIFKNDFTALAMSIPRLQASDFVQVGGTVDTSQKTALGVVGAGTGLGVSGLIPYHNLWIPLEGEGGHVSLSPANAREVDILKVCWKSFEHVSAERLVSGMGLQNLYKAICELEGEQPEPLSPREVSVLGMGNANRFCAEALDTFCGLLGSVAGDLALTLGAYNGVYIGGGIVPKLGSYFEASSFRARFEAKGRFSGHLAKVPVFVIKAENPALYGIGEAFSLT
ncbi:glucokinase [Leucothrix sargassi]|nr:glucokinase [Leucothrix sargassi]